jgi:hypothetical protein
MGTGNRNPGSLELRMIDAEIAHLRVVVETVLREPNHALPANYWRRRLTELMEGRHLLHHQFADIVGLLERLDTSGAQEIP